MEMIPQRFIEANIKIKSNEKLLEYITFCLENNMKKRINGKTALHHILPKSLFPAFTNIKKNVWNGCHLTFYNHYYAHWLLTESVDEYSVYYSFCAMHNKDLKNERLKENELISKTLYETIMFEKSKRHKESLYKKKKLDNGLFTTAAAQVGIKNRIHKNKKIILFDGTESTVAKEEGKKHSKYLNAPIILEDGTKTTRCIESGKKHSEYLNKKIILNDGTESTIAKERGKDRSKLLRSKGKFYNLFNIFTGLIKENVCRAEITKISAVLHKKTKNDYMGKNFQSKKSLNAANNLHLVGLYVEEISK